MVVPRDSSRSKLREFVGSRIEELRDKLACIITEGVSVDLTAHNEHGAVWENNAVGKCSLICHIADSCDCCCGVHVADCDDVCI